MNFFTESIGLVIPWICQIGQLRGLFSFEYQMYVTVIPLIVCVVGVNLFFRHTMSIVWFCCKLMISVMVYLQFRDLIYSSIGTDPLGLEAALFGVDTHIFEVSMSTAHEFMKYKTLTFIDSICPICFASPPIAEPIIEEEMSPWVHWMGSTLFI